MVSRAGTRSEIQWRMRLKTPGDSGNDDVRDRIAPLEGQLEIYDALGQALNRRTEVFSAVDSAETVGDAISNLRALLGVSEVGALALLEMQFRRLPRDERLEDAGAPARVAR